MTDVPAVTPGQIAEHNERRKREPFVVESGIRPLIRVNSCGRGSAIRAWCDLLMSDSRRHPHAQTAAEVAIECNDIRWRDAREAARRVVERVRIRRCCPDIVGNGPDSRDRDKLSSRRRADYQVGVGTAMAFGVGSISCEVCCRRCHLRFQFPSGDPEIRRDGNWNRVDGDARLEPHG